MSIRRLAFPFLLISIATAAHAGTISNAPEEPSKAGMLVACAIGLLAGWAAGNQRWKSMNRRPLARYVQKKRYESQPDAETGTR